MNMTTQIQNEEVTHMTKQDISNEAFLAFLKMNQELLECDLPMDCIRKSVTKHWIEYDEQQLNDEYPDEISFPRNGFSNTEEDQQFMVKQMRMYTNVIVVNQKVYNTFLVRNF